MCRAVIALSQCQGGTEREQIMNTTTKAQRACLTWISDPAHAWLAVTLDEEDGFPGAVQYASEYSYYDAAGDNFNGVIYLEEDQDAPAFIKALGIDQHLVPAHHFDDTEHFVRNLPRWSVI